MRTLTKEQVETWPLHQGKRELLKSLSGEQLSYKEIVRAQCYLCMGGYGDQGESKDCKGYSCPAYHSAFPYKPKEKRQPKKQLTDEHKAKLAAGREKAAKGKGKGTKK